MLFFDAAYISLPTFIPELFSGIKVNLDVLSLANKNKMFFERNVTYNKQKKCGISI